ncbi:hypothetical protein SVAN01_08992 [Stagonosporopsis vannaccii]|nr:hypothetical protein SVAN01_08992 [Stagonosporopsis vannaccii]
MAFSTLRGWIQQCSTSHRRCQRFLQEPYLPTRVVEILDSRSVRLRETDNENGLYTCLSHCWGVQPIIRTTTASIAAHRTSIPWANLPKTFQDAVNITSRLGIKYIWIDSLCILQDDLNDWRHEGGKMCDVYSNSYLTIAASKSKDGSGGCYATADRKDDTTHWFANADGALYSVHGRKRIWHVGDQDDVDGDIADVFPLTTRAWVLQERLLSPRIVHFGPVEVSWECKEGEACECTGWRSADAHDRSELSTRHLISAEMAFSHHQVWRRIVQEYSTKKLSNEADIFPALQGIAKSLHHQGDYYAGFWETESLLLDLLWTNQDAIAPKMWRAPSWSWASVQGQIEFPRYDDHLESLASILSINTVPLGSDPFGQLASGQLRLAGLCIEARIKGISTPTSWYLNAPNLGTRFMDFPAITTGNGEEAQERGDRFDWLAVDRHDEIYEDQNVKVMAMTLMRASECNLETLCLVLSCVDPEEEVYKRIGVAILENDMGTFECFGDGLTKILTII